MNVSLKWLGTLVDIKGLDPEEMAETLTVDGIPVEHVIHPGKGIQGVVTGKFFLLKNIRMLIIWSSASWTAARAHRSRS